MPPTRGCALGAMLLISRIALRIAYLDDVKRCGAEHASASTTLCERRSENQGSMPFSSLNRFRTDRQMALSGAWQRWTELPEGASLWLRLHGFTSLSNPPRYFDIGSETLARRPVSPSAGRSRALSRYRRTRSTERVGGHLEDGVPHAEALSPTNRVSPIKRCLPFARYVEKTLVDSALATTPQASSM